MVARLKIIHDRPECIGCGACVAICEKHWEMADDGKTDLKGAKHIDEIQELELEEIGQNKEAAEICPVNCIHIEEDGKKII